jgi:hypothetical protein
MSIGRIKYHTPKTRVFSRTRQEIGGKKRKSFGLILDADTWVNVCAKRRITEEHDRL